MIGGSGLTLRVSSVRWDHDTSSWRTCQGCLPGMEDWTLFSGRWWKAGTLRNGVCSPRPGSGSVLPTEGSASSCWPSATAQDSKASGAAAYGTESGRHSGTTLTDAASRMWPTPVGSVANDGEDPSTFRRRVERLKQMGVNGNGAGTPLTIASVEWRLGRQAPRTETLGAASLSGSTRRLNPAFVEWLMGLPPGWTDPLTPIAPTDFVRWATAWSPNKPPGPSGSSPSDLDYIRMVSERSIELLAGAEELRDLARQVEAREIQICEPNR